MQLEPQQETSKLPPLPPKLDGFSEEVKIDFSKCSHKKAVIRGDELVCSCGASWRGPGIEQIYQSLDQT